MDCISWIAKMPFSQNQGQADSEEEGGEGRGSLILYSRQDQNNGQEI